MVSTTGTYGIGRRKPLFPIGALFFSEGIGRLMDAGRLDPRPFLQRHTRGDWGDVPDQKWQENNSALLSGRRLDSFYVVTRDISICIFTASNRSETQIVLPSEA